MGTDPRIPDPVFFERILDAHSFAPIVTELQLFTAGQGTPNPGLVKPCIVRGVFATWAFVGENEPGDWLLHLRTNEGIIDAATMDLPAGTPGEFSKVAGDWSVPVSFQAGETYHVIANGPSKRAVILRAILRFEECPG